MTNIDTSDMFARRVPVDRNRTPQEVLDATDRMQYTDRKVVDGMPRGEGIEVEVIFFRPEPEERTRPGWISNDDLEKAFNRRGLKQAPPDDVSAVNENDPAFADERPNRTNWKDATGNWCSASFRYWYGVRVVVVDRRGDDGHHGIWWFAGVRLPAQTGR